MKPSLLLVEDRLQLIQESRTGSQPLLGQTQILFSGNVLALCQVDRLLFDSRDYDLLWNPYRVHGNILISVRESGPPFAQTPGIPFEFFPVAEKVGNLDAGRFNISKREAVAVHWLHHSLYDVTGSDTNTIWLLQRIWLKLCS